jgi:hypothetical protein
MTEQMTEMPTFLLNLRRDEGNEPYVVSCSIVGDLTGFRGVVRRFRNAKALESELGTVGIEPERYAAIISGVDAKPGETKHFGINLNEAQRLSLIQTDTTE